MIENERTSSLEKKIELIRSHFLPVLGSRVVSYETAEHLHDEGTWTPWPDLPIRLFTDTSIIVAVSWWNFDQLWMAANSTLPFSVEGETVRWVENGIERINGMIGSVIRSVRLGRGEFSVESRSVEIWTRLLIQVDDFWLEVFNALDENGYDLHSHMPTGDFVTCV